MSEETPAFRLVTDNSAFVRKPGQTPVEVVPEVKETTVQALDAPVIQLAKAAGDEGAGRHMKEPGAPRECGGCSKTWGENMMIYRSRRDDGVGEKLWVCPVCQQNGGYKETGTEKVRVRGSSLDTTKLFIGFALALVVISTLIFWKLHSDTVNQKVEWITEDWVEKPVEKWPALTAQWEARVEGIAAPIQAPAMLVEKRDGSFLAIAFVEREVLTEHKIKDKKFGELGAKIKSSVLKVPGKPDLILGEFINPKGVTQELAWMMRCDAPRAQLPCEPVKVRRQAFAIGMLGKLVRPVGGKQTVEPCRIIQGVTGGDEFVILTDKPIGAEPVLGSLLIDEFGHAVAYGFKIVEGTESRVGQRVTVRGGLTFKGAER